MPRKLGRKTTARNALMLLVFGLSEFIGTFLLLFLGCSGSVPAVLPLEPYHIQACFVFGMTVMIIVQIFGHVSGAHINPVVTIAALITDLVSIPAAGVYIFSQFLGAILGYGALLTMIPQELLYVSSKNTSEPHGFCATVPHPKLSTLQALIIEFVSTSILIYVCCSVWDKRNHTKQDSIPIKFGITITTLGIALGPLSGGSMNPARTFGPALYTGVWHSHWIYWVGPLSGTVISSYIYKYVFDRYQRPAEQEQVEFPLNQVNAKNESVPAPRKQSSDDINE